jgi:hypothetical protein
LSNLVRVRVRVRARVRVWVRVRVRVRARFRSGSGVGHLVEPALLVRAQLAKGQHLVGVRVGVRVRTDRRTG